MKKWILLTIFCFFAIFADQKHKFFSLKSAEVNLRVGPGEEYPVIWVLVKAGLPVKLIAEFNNWRKVQLIDGTEGWIHVNIISRKNTAMVQVPKKSAKFKNDPYEISKPTAIMYKYNSRNRPIAQIEENVVVRVLRKEDDWVKVEINGIKGWMERKNLWGAEEI